MLSIQNRILYIIAIIEVLLLLTLIYRIYIKDLLCARNFSRLDKALNKIYTKPCHCEASV